MSRSILKYALLYGLLLLPVLIFSQLSLRSIELEARESAERRKDSVVKRVEEAILTFKSRLNERLGKLVELAGERDHSGIDKERGLWEVYVFDRELRLEFPSCRPCPPIEAPVPERDTAPLMRAWLRSRDPLGLKRAAARTFWSTGSVRLQAACLVRLAAAAISEGAPADAVHHLRLVCERFPGARDLTGIPLGPASSVSLVRTLRSLGRKADAARELVTLLSDLVYARYPINSHELAYFTGEARALARQTEQDPSTPHADRESLARLRSSPFPLIQQRFRAGGGLREVEGRMGEYGGKEYIHFDRRSGPRIVLALAPVNEVNRLFDQVLGSPTEEGYRVFRGGEIPRGLQERFSTVMHLEIPYLGQSVTIGADRDQLVSLARTRRTFLTGLVSLGLVVFFLGCFLFARDVRRQLELARLKAEFIANVSHELKTPLTTIRMFAETLFHGRCRQDRHQDYLRKILTEADHLTLLIENVLQLSRAEEVIVDRRKTTCPLLQLANDAVERVKVRWDDRTFVVDLADDLAIDCDGKLITLALANLVDNAAKYSRASEPVRVTGGVEGGRVFLSVADRGRGIPVEDQQRLFQRFFRARNSTDMAGMGLGLFLVQRIAALHDGRVEFSSTEGVGSVFTMRLSGRVRTIPPAGGKA